MDQSVPFVKAWGPNWSFIYGEDNSLWSHCHLVSRLTMANQGLRPYCFYISFSTSAEHAHKIHVQVTPFSNSKQTGLRVLEWKSLNQSTELQSNGTE
jgi:hypothetical protein